MIEIKYDGSVIHAPADNNQYLLVVNPHLRIELNKPEVLTFTLPPINTRYGHLHKRKGVVTVEIDGEEYFRGQIIDERPNLYNMREYTCEGALSYLSDSIQRPLAITGDENLTAKAHFISLIETHNSQVGAEKRFTPGIVDATEKVMQKEDTDYASTLSAIEERLVSRYGGFLRVRRENGVNYIDWLKELTDVCTQAVEFGQNIIDLDGLIDTRETGSVLVPLGATTKGKKLTIAAVNGGADYIESPELIAKYGRIVVTKEFPTIKDANELFAKGREALAEMEDDESFDITAVDLHALGVDVSALRVGLLTPIRVPHEGIDKSKILYAADMDLTNIEKTVYTFGVPRQTLTEALVEAARGGGAARKKADELSLIVTDAYIEIDRMKGDILLMAYQDEMNTRFSEAWIGINGVSARLDMKADQEVVDEISRTVTEAYVLLDGINADLLLKADKTYVEDLEKTVNQAQVDINGAKAELLLKADTETVNALGERVSSAEIAINGTTSHIALKADKSHVENLETVLGNALMEIDGAKSTIVLKADATTVDALGERVSSAEIALDGANSEIRLKADKTYVDNLVADKLTATNLAAEIAKIEKLSLQRVSGSIAEFSALTATSFAIGDVQMSSRALTMGDVVSTNVLTSKGSAIDLAHSHAVTVNPDGTITLGEVSATGGNFRIADTQAYKDGVSAAKASVTLSSAGWVNGVNTVTASNGKTHAVSLPAFSASGGTSFNSDHKTTVYFSTDSVSQPLKSLDVDASSVYDAGYEAGWAAARAEVRRVINSTNKQVWIYGPAATVDSSARFWTIDLDVSITSHRNSAPSTIYAQAEANIKLNSSTAVTKTATSTLTINSGML